MTSWLLIEQPGPWPQDALETTLAATFPRDVAERARAAGLRPMLIRRPGRHERTVGRRTVFAASGMPGNRWLERLDVTDLTELATLDLEAVAAGRPGHGTPVDDPLLLVCTHGTKDMCCAVLGRPLVTALAENHPDLSWEVSHLGGDRWAGNMLVVPNGFLYGQLTPADAALVAKTALDGQVCPDGLRGRTSAAGPWEQSAEIAVRRETGLRGLDAVEAVGRHETADDASTVLVRAAGRHYEVTVRRQRAELGENRCTPQLVLSDYVAERIHPTRALVTA